MAMLSDATIPHNTYDNDIRRIIGRNVDPLDAVQILFVIKHINH